MSEQSKHYDPDEYRMSLGDHLEELRKRIMLALLGVIVAFGVCAYFGDKVIEIFCRPLIGVLADHKIPPQLWYTSAGDPFTVYLKISMISSAVVAAPWIILQIWHFVAAGLYPKERKTIWRFAPLSIALALAGVVFCFTIVLPLCLRFFIEFSGGMSLHMPQHAPPPVPLPTPSITQIQAVPGAPATLKPYEIWYDTLEQRLKFALPTDSGALQNMVINFGPSALVSPMITLPEYIDMVLMWLLIFGLAFQLPLVTMALVRIGIVEISNLRNFRRYVYVGLAIVSSMIMPDVFSGTLMLLIPLCLLYELGILLARTGRRT